MIVNRKELKAGDEVWVAHAGCYTGEPYGHVYGGKVLAVGNDGGFVYQTAGGRVDNCHAWSAVVITTTEAESWVAVADQLDKIADGVTAKADECRAKGRAVEVAA
jgi:hypothetical protein